MNFKTFPSIPIKNINQIKTNVEYLPYAISFPRFGSLSIPSEKNAFMLVREFICKWITKSDKLTKKHISSYILALTNCFGIATVEMDEQNEFENDATKAKITFYPLIPKTITVQCPVCESEIEILEDEVMVSCSKCSTSFKA